ncbi:Ring finger domain/Zn-finger in ubiquitin-hydrolases and other protein [Trypanosoma brucei equiperdum]|uniref:Ring finger domain/Zn-finger in ubiquitin-hydrolases and other protein n=1 Tax=Trypanosoma brucei equiperdum TaxID=630700 RepID=A0A3L6L079_9TRYP|nr:Ring finger domain/Zn-finger in ubiquitin-hydrolases and other protein [Trypanosoma brucei equiperdum]
MSVTGFGDVVVSFDAEGVVVVGLTYERSNATQWLLLPEIPVEVPLVKVLRDLEESGASRQRSPGRMRGEGVKGDVCLPDGEVGSPCNACGVNNIRSDCCISVARVGHIPERNRAYCLLLELSSSSDAADVQRDLLHVEWANGPLCAPQFLQSVGRIMRVEHEGRDAACVSNCAGWRTQVSTDNAEDVCLRVLCSVSCGVDGASSRRQLESEKEISSVALRRDAPLAPIEEFCPICREEIASGRTCVVTMCTHVFHLVCLMKHLEDVSSYCPLCRFSMSSLETKCNACGTCQDLWSCLVCGWVGCGKGRHGHSIRHFHSTGHSCAVQNSTSRIWNYRASTFLHHQLAMELGYEDDARAERAAAQEEGRSALSVRHSGEKPRVSASSYWRSRWWWDEKEEEAAQELNGDYVREYYLRVMEELMQEQADYFEGRTMVEGENAAVPIGTWKKLQSAERRQRRSLASRYIAGLRRIALHSQMAVNNFVKQELLWRDSLREELLLQSHTNQGLNARISSLGANIDKARQRGEQQVALKEEELRDLQGRLESLMRDLE